MTARVTLATAALALHATLLPAQTHRLPPAVDAPRHANSLVSGKLVAVASILFAGALMGDHEFREEAQERRAGLSNAVADLGNAFGDWRFIVPALTAGYLAGELAGNKELTRTVVQTGAAAALATGLTGGLKFAAGRARPYVAGNSFHFRPFSGASSFPSGHSAVAFAIATAVADRTRDGWSDYVLYGAATLTALSRINDNKHWTSDVLIGALVGHVSARWVTRRMGPLQVTPAGLSIYLRF
jgi:membrane-associated phospholipid phosphatase